MDSRLFLLNGQRVSRLRKVDVPLVARAIVAVYRRRASVGTGTIHGIRYVRIWDDGSSVVIMREDWVLIQPLIQNGALDPAQFPVNTHAGQNRTFSSLVVDLTDKELYDSVLGALTPLFPN